MGAGYSNGFALLVVLFILLIIVGAAIVRERKYQLIQLRFRSITGHYLSCSIG